jgi:glutathione S-transferase
MGIGSTGGKIMSEVEIVGFELSTYVRTARLVCAEKGVAYTLTPGPLKGPEDLRSDAYLALHPFGKMPVMRHGGVTLYETSAIARYVDAAFDGPALVPAEPLAAARMEQWISAFNAYMYGHMISDYVLQYAFPKGPDGAPDRAVIDAAVPLIAKDISLLDAALAEGPYLTGDTPSIGDCLLIPAIDYLAVMPETGEMISAAANVARWQKVFSARPSYRETLPERLREGAG